MKRRHHIIFSLALPLVLITSVSAMNQNIMEKQNKGFWSFLSFSSTSTSEITQTKPLLVQDSNVEKFKEVKEERELLRKEQDTHIKRLKTLSQKNENSEEFTSALIINTPTYTTVVSYQNVEKILSTLPITLHLTTLDLRRTGLNDETAPLIANMLETNKTLHELSLYVNKIGDKGIATIMQSMAKNTTLTWLNIGDNAFTDEAADDIVQMMKTNKTLKSLGLDFANFGDLGANKIATELKENTTLTYIDLSFFQKRSIEGFINLTAAIKVNKSLTYVRLASWELGLTQQYIGQLLSENKTLTTLDLSGATIAGQSNSIAPITEALKINSTLQKLNLDENFFDDTSATFFADMLKINKGLTELNLSNSKLADTGAKVLAEGLVPNNTLQLLMVTNNAVTKEGRKPLNALSNSEKRNFNPCVFWLYLPESDPQSPPKN